MTSGPGRTPNDVRDLILGGPPRYTRDDLARISGIPIERARQIWRAMGFADTGGARAFTDSDLTGLLLIKSLVDRGLLDDATAIEVARSLGQTTARLAEWQGDTLRRRLVDTGRLDPAQGLDEDDLDVIYHEVASLVPELERLLIQVWRRQLAAVTARRLTDDDDAEDDREDATCVGFADMVGFTRLSRHLEEDELGALVERFEANSSDVVAATGARLVKTLGDEVLFLADEAAQAAETALRLHESHAHDPGVPEMRVGLATGEVLSRMGDVFGSTVNLASRLTALARPGSTLVDGVTAHALEDEVAFRVRAIRPRNARGIGLVRPYVLTRS